MSDPRTEALARLPHGPEFRFLDRLLQLEPGRHGVGEYTVRGDEPFLRGHFAGQPIFPGVLLVEAAAQLAGTVAQSDPNLEPLPGLKLTALRGVKILGAAKPGQTIRLEARITGRLANLIQATAAAAVDGVVILNADLTLSGDFIGAAPEVPTPKAFGARKLQT
jgi:3-hydroxyacyl-[acyl-carrier-protein] dehydratase